MCNFHCHLCYYVLLVIGCMITISNCDVMQGPDPWDVAAGDTRPTSHIKDYVNVPPDLKPVKRKKLAETTLGTGEWFFKRILGILLRGGQVKVNEDGVVDVSLQMKFNQKEWDLLDEYLKSTAALSEDMFRRSVGYIEQAIYRPSITEQIATAWSDYIQIHLSSYMTEITWLLCILAGAGAFMWLWNHMSHRHLVMAVVISLYLYEVFTSYKEAEQQELDRFMSAMDSCKWFFWSSSCEVLRPDPLIFIKHMNPLKIGIRMFTTIVSEPVVTLSHTLKIMVHGITDGLWFPFDKIVYVILILTLNVLLLFLLILILFNYVLNIPFNLNFLGLLSVGFQQRKRNVLGNRSRVQRGPYSPEVGDRLSGATINRLLDVCSKALNAAQSNTTAPSEEKPLLLKRSASTGRLPDTIDLNKLFENNNKALTHWQRQDKKKSSFGMVTKRNKYTRVLDGSGDAS